MSTNILMNVLQTVIMIIFAGLIFIFVIHSIHRWLRPERSQSKMATQLYAGGETVSPKERRYLDSTFQFVAYFSILDFIGFLLGTLFIRVVINASILTSASIALILVLFMTIFLLVTPKRPVLS